MRIDGRDDDDARAISLLHQIIEAIMQLGINRFRRHKHKSGFLGLSGDQIFLRNIRHVLGNVGAQSRGRGFACLVGLGVPIGGESFEREFCIDHQRAAVGQKHTAVGPGLVGERVLEGVGPLGQAVLDDGFHAPLAERAARLLVGEHALQGRHLTGEIGDVLLRAVDDREALGELLQILGCALLGLLERIAQPMRDRIEPLVDGMGELRLAFRQHADHGLKPRGGLGLRVPERHHRRIFGGHFMP